MYSKSFYAVATSLAVVLGLSACSKSEPAPEPIRAVRVLTVGVDAIQSSPEYAAEVRAQGESRLAFRVSGKLVKRSVELGQIVKVGQVLAQLDAQDYRLAVDAARAQSIAATSNRDVAAADFKRYKELKEQNFISGAELERREAALKAAQAQYEQAQSQLSLQGNQAGYAVLVADVAGVVTAVDAEVGQVVAAGTPVLRIAQAGAQDVVFSVPEDKVKALKLGAPVEVRAWSDGALAKASVREIGGSADPVTRTFTVKAALPAHYALPLGATVSVLADSLGYRGATVMKLPTTALFQEVGKTMVWVLNPQTMTVAAQAIEITTADGNAVVVASGLKPGMLVVSAGVHTLSPGQKVSIYKEPKQPDAATPATAAK